MVHPSLISVPPSPSSIELNHAIDAILGSDSTVLATDVPDLFAKYEHANNGPAILNLAQLAELRGVVSSEAYASVQMSHEEIFAMIHYLRGSKTVPPPQTEVSTPTTAKHARRRSARIRTASDSSSTEEDEQTPLRTSSSAAGAGKRPIPRRSFPGDSAAYMLPSTIATSPEGALPPRVKKLSDASTKFEQRSSRDDPPGAFVALGRRPAAQSRRSSGHYSAGGRSEDGHTASESTYKTHGRSVSSASVVSPLSRSPGATSPISPPGDGYGSDISDSLGWRSGGQGPLITKFMKEGRQAEEELQRLNAVIAELKNRVKTLEHEREVAQQTHEDLVSEMELRMESDRQEHDSKIKDQMGRTEQRYRTEIEAKEAEITEITDALDKVTAKLAESHNALELEKLRAVDLRKVLEERDMDIAKMRLELDYAGDQKQQVEEDLGKINAHNAELQEKITASKAIENDLASKMLEIDHLKSTVSDLDRQLTDLKGGAGFGGGGISSSGPATLTRNGGTQLSSELQAAEPLVHTVYLDRTTTHTVTRTVNVAGSTMSYQDAIVGTEPLDILNDPRFADERAAIREQIASELEADGARTPVQSGPSLAEEALRSPPAYSASPGPMDAAALMKHTHPEVRKEALRSGEDPQKAYDLLSKATGKRCHLFEEELESDEILRNKHDGTSDSKETMVSRVYSWVTTISFIHMTGLVALTVIATQALGTPAQRDPYDSFAYNGALSWFDQTAAMARAGRVPT